MASWSAAVNRRLTGFAAGSSSGTTPVWARAANGAGVVAMVCVFLSRPGAMVGYNRCLTSCWQTANRDGWRGGYPGQCEVATAAAQPLPEY